ncbi:MAG: OmpA family [Bacteroidota bacterium]|jgi:outer membrane protein OmpA-like peptidoglycan-associated protein
MLFRIALHLSVIGTLCVSVAAQSSLSETLGLRLGAGLAFSQHSGPFTQTAGMLDCEPLSFGDGYGPTGLLGIEFPVSSWGMLGIELALTNRSGSFSRTNTYPLRDSITGQDVTMSTLYTLNATLSNVDVAMMLHIPVIGTAQQRHLGLSVGPRLALPMTATFEQRESVVSPETAVFFVQGSPVQERLIRSGALQSRTPLMIALSTGLESLIALSDRLSLVPRLSVDYFVTNVVGDASWKQMSIRADASLRFSFKKTPLMPPPPPPPVIVEAPQAPVYAPPILDLSPRSFVGEIVTGNVLRASIPIVNAVFFDSARADVPPSYKVAADGSQMSTDPVDAHAWILPRIAAIIASNPQARITLEGATSGPVTEPEGLALAKRRAESVRTALVGLGVPSSSITVNSSLSPRITSNVDLQGGREENRRVDIIVQNAPLQRFVLTEEFAELRGTATVASRFQGGPPEATPTSQVITVNRRDTVVTTMNATVSMPVVVRLDNSGEPPATIAASSSAGGQYSETQLPVPADKLTRRRIALSTDGFEAILRFDYNSAELLEDVKTLLRQLADQLPEGSTIMIEGSTDILGSLERNKLLSNNRAANTESYIRSITTKKFTFSTTSQASPFSDATPQGRFLNRNIRIRVR